MTNISEIVKTTGKIMRQYIATSSDELHIL